MSITDTLAIYFPEYFKDDTACTRETCLSNKAELEKIVDKVEAKPEDSENRKKNQLAAWIVNMDKLVNSKTKLAAWIVNNIDSLSMSQREIAKATGFSLGTVESTMKILSEGDIPFLIKSELGTYRINPNLGTA